MKILNFFTLSMISLSFYNIPLTASTLDDFNNTMTTTMSDLKNTIVTSDNVQSIASKITPLKLSLEKASQTSWGLFSKTNLLRDFTGGKVAISILSPVFDKLMLNPTLAKVVNDKLVTYQTNYQESSNSDKCKVRCLFRVLYDLGGGADGRVQQILNCAPKDSEPCKSLYTGN